jgi:DNA-binding MarR family transcriptional regulator
LISVTRAMLPSVETSSRTRRPVIDGCTCHKARRLARALVRLYDREMVPNGLTVGQFSMLRTLAPHPMKTGEFADELGVERTTLTRNLRPLISDGLVVATRGADARTRLLAVSDKGRDVMRRSKSDWRRVQCQIEDLLGEMRVAALHEMIDGVLSDIDHNSPTPTFKRTTAAHAASVA